MNNKNRRIELARKSKIALIIMAATTIIVCIVALFKNFLVVPAFFMCTFTGFAIGREEMIDLYDSWLNEEEDKIEGKNL